MRRCVGASVLCVCATVVLSACSRKSDHERLGDRRYAEQAWIDALAEYRLAARQHKPSLELRAKLGAAALHAGALSEAAQAYADMARADRSAAGDAAEGLLRTARTAVGNRDVAALRLAIEGLRTIAPERLPELGGALAAGIDERHGADQADVIFTAAAVSPGTLADSLIAIWAEALAKAGRCEQGMRGYEAVVRRNPSPAITRSATGGLAGCRVEAGRAALSAGQLDAAEEQFREAIVLGTPDSLVRLAWVLIGDARWANGDTTVAAESYRKAIEGASDENPIAQRAREQLQKLTGNTEPQ